MISYVKMPSSTSFFFFFSAITFLLVPQQAIGCRYVDGCDNCCCLTVKQRALLCINNMWITCYRADPIPATVEAVQVRPNSSASDMQVSSTWLRQQPLGSDERGSNWGAQEQWRRMARWIRNQDRGDVSLDPTFSTVYFSAPRTERGYLSRTEISNRASIHHWLTWYWSLVLLLFSTNLYC